MPHHATKACTAASRQCVHAPFLVDTTDSALAGQLYLENFGDVRPSAWSSLDDPAFAPPTRPFSATGHRPGLMMEALRLYDPAIDNGAFLMAVQDPPHTPNRNAVASPSFDAYMGSGMGPPPPPPRRCDSLSYDQE